MEIKKENKRKWYSDLFKNFWLKLFLTIPVMMALILVFVVMIFIYASFTATGLIVFILFTILSYVISHFINKNM